MDVENFGERIALKWVEREIESMLTLHRDISDVDIRNLAKSITRHIDEIWQKNLKNF